MYRIPFALVLAIMVAPLSQVQSNFNGKWQWRAPAGTQEIILDFKADGRNLTGTITMVQAKLSESATGGGAYFLDPDTPSDELRALFFPPVTFPISDGRIDGNTISFTQNTYVTFGNLTGGRPKVEKLYYKGQVEGDRITFRRTYQAMPDSQWIVGAHSVTFSVERVK